MHCLQDGETALYQAADSGQERCVSALLEAGCDPNILTVPWQMLPSLVFFKHLNSDLVLFAVKYFSAVNPLSPELNPVKFFRHVISLLLVLQCHCSALHPVSEIGDASLVQLLLEYKADPDLRNQVREDKFG